MFKDINVKNSNARTFMIFYIDDTTSFADIFTSKSLLEFEKFSKVENKASTKAQTKKKNSKKKEFKEKEERKLRKNDKEADK